MAFDALEGLERYIASDSPMAFPLFFLCFSYVYEKPLKEARGKASRR